MAAACHSCSAGSGDGDMLTGALNIHTHTDILANIRISSGTQGGREPSERTNGSEAMRWKWVVGLVATVMMTTTTATVFAGSWGPRTSTYNKVVRVEGSGVLSRKGGGSESKVTAKDRANDGNTVYGYTDFFWISESCSSFGVSKVIEIGTSRCRTDTGWRTHRYTKAVNNKQVTETFFQDWCNQDGYFCADYGYKIVTGSCAQMGWPVPDSCTYAWVEFHRP